MARRKSNILDDLIKLPWWVSVVLSALAYVGLRFVLPLFIPAGPTTLSNMVTKAWLTTLSQTAPFVAFVFLIPAPIAAYRQWREGRLLDSQTGLASIRALSWRQFEALVAEACRREGYAVFRPSGNGPDGGVDLVLKKDGETVLVQCKHWKAWKVGAKIVRELNGVVAARRAQGGIVITTGVFTQEARDFAGETSVRLIEGEEVSEYVRSVQRAPAQPSIPLSPKTAPLPLPTRARPAPAPSQTSARRCPKCGSPMVLRTAKQGAHAGQQFWSCSEFPRCRGVAPVSEQRD